jgi:hypothetical protein
VTALEELQAKYGKLGSWSDLPEGWKTLVDNLLAELKKTPGWNTKYVAQVKEKFAGLRFYIDRHEGVSEEQFKIWQDMIDKVEAESCTTCMDCGRVGATRRSTGYWLYTSCDEHVKI